jgi:hypothetical protein
MINRNIAAALELTIPLGLQVAADRLIERGAGFAAPMSADVAHSGSPIRMEVNLG